VDGYGWAFTPLEVAKPVGFDIPNLLAVLSQMLLNHSGFATASLMCELVPWNLAFLVPPSQIRPL
jgi:hypothetical protein